MATLQTDFALSLRTFALELALDVSALGSAYLGAVSFTQLREALRVQELREGATARADARFAWHPLPWCPEIF